MPPPAVVKVPNSRQSKKPSPAQAVVKKPSAASAASEKSKKAVSAAKDVEEHLKKLSESSDRSEEEAARQRHEQRVLGGDIEWLQYRKPANLTDIDQCMQVDKYNRDVFENNNANLERVNGLQRKLGLNKINIEAPPKYTPIARAKYEEMLKDESFCIMSAIFYLAKRDVLPEKDYKQADIETLPKRAADIAFREECDRKVAVAGDEGIDITPAVGSAHKKHCTCENLWDGVSERCIGEGVRIRWRRGRTHHFLRPVVVVETY